MRSRPSLGWAVAFGLAVLVGLPLMGLSQQHLMGEQAQVTACGFYFLDDGGALQDASSSVDLTTTFCPEVAGGELTFSFSTFSLGAGDSLFLWWGPEATGPPAFAFGGGALLGSDLGNGDGTSNPSGCMTWRYAPSGSGSSNWAALVSCSAPCDRPLVSALVGIEGEPQASPAEACLGAAVGFDASGSTAAVGLDQGTWAWDFGDGSLSSEGGMVEHIYTEPGVYPVQLVFTDSTGCSSVNSLGWTVHVAAPIGIDVPSVGPLVCAGGAAVLALGPGGVTTQPVESQPVASFGAGVMIPDSVGQAFSSEITFSGFPAGQGVSDVGDIGGVSISLEHSFILDLAIELECPNGSSMMLQGWPGGFGGCVDAGIPVTGDTPPQPGTGYDYSWTPGATEDWQAAALELLPNPSSGCASSTLPLPAGAYAAVGDWNQLVGCPVNGTWTLNILDTQEGDNGFLFGWSIEFAADITPEQTVFEATVGGGCDSMFWAPVEPWGFDFAALDGCSSIVVEPTEAGSFGYVFTAVDAFGCTADTTVFISVEPGLDFAIGSDFLDPFSGVETTLCSGVPLTLQATSLDPVPSGTSYNWLLDGSSSGQLGTTYFDVAPDTGQHEIIFQATTVAPPPIVGLCQFEWRDTIEVVTAPTVSLNVPDACSNEPVQWEAPATGNGLTWDWILSAQNGDTLSHVSWANPVLGTQPSGGYTLEATVTDVHGCTDLASADFEVFTAPDPGFSLADVCAGEVLSFSLNDSVGYASPSTSAVWSLVGGGDLTDLGGHLGTTATGGGGFPQIT
ncbi:MAG: PKD domain-containing protein, partial [Flavobacteriales bacterium]|nr:PKD domain-containing protein [Flavobacteriales bacterium]